MHARLSASILFTIAATALLAGTASGEWVFTEAYIDPPDPDHERAITFHVTLEDRNVTGSGQQGAGNGTGNGTGSGQNGTGNQTGNVTVNITSVGLVIGKSSNGTGQVETKYTLSRTNGTDGFSVRLGPWAPGFEFPYRFEASLSNGSVLDTNESWLRTPDVLGFKWHDSFLEAADIATSLGRPLLVFVYSDFDHSLEYMLPNRTQPSLSGPFCNDAAVALSPAFVCLKVDADSDPALAARLGADETPCLIFINATSNSTLDRISGRFGNATLIGEMRYILGEGPRPSKPGPYVADVVVETAALAITLTAGSALMLYYYFMKRRGH